MDISNEMHEHITMDELAKAVKANKDESNTKDLIHLNAVKEKITKCHECRRRVAVAMIAKKVFGIPIWKLRHDESLVIDLRREDIPEWINT